ncbi:TadE/TadG family type IV pilus assembly protein [Collimonas sp. NPDC087041]|uniref:TadE/TadG family type IV pilus assembly protein n=1 Tax=Collimonas sp. NPDC087041 TaxID=3363960 RepID=UPI0037FF9DA7
MKTSRYRRQCGQAMVELIVVSGVMVALFLGIWYLGKFHDIQAATIQAARYAAWERTVHPAGYADSQIEQQTRARIFSWNRDAFRSTDGIASNAAWNTQTSMWLDHRNQDALIAKPSDVTVGTTSGPLPGSAAGTVDSVLNGLTGAIGALTGGEKLNTGGFYKSQVSVKIANVGSLPEPLDNLNLTLTESNALVTDSWDADSPRQAAMRTRSFAPTAIFEKIQPILTPLEWALSIIEPSFKNFKPGEICPDIVPADRLGTGARNIPMYQSASGCY